MTALARSPQAMFGVLIALEKGMDPARLADKLGQGLNALLDAAEAARQGEMPRQRPWLGERMASEVRQELASVRIKGDELFLTPWHRAAIQLMARPEGAMTGELRHVAEQFGKTVDGGKLLWRLCETLGEQGFPVLSTPDARGRESRYQFAEPDRQRLFTVIRNGWVVL